MIARQIPTKQTRKHSSRMRTDCAITRLSSEPVAMRPMVDKQRPVKSFPSLAVQSPGPACNSHINLIRGASRISHRRRRQPMILSKISKKPHEIENFFWGEGGKSPLKICCVICLITKSTEFYRKTHQICFNFFFFPITTFNFLSN